MISDAGYNTIGMTALRAAIALGRIESGRADSLDRQDVKSGIEILRARITIESWSGGRVPTKAIAQSELVHRGLKRCRLRTTALPALIDSAQQVLKSRAKRSEVNPRLVKLFRAISDEALARTGSPGCRVVRF